MITDNGIEYDRIEVIKEKMPSGHSYTTQYFFNNELVRQDVQLVLSPLEEPVAPGAGNL